MSVKDFFTEQALGIVHELRDNLRATDRVVTGKTADSINFEVSETSERTAFQIVASKVLPILQEGRRPSAKMPPVQNILQWIRDRGIKAQIPDQSLAFLIARKIQREGFKGTPGLIDSVINDRLVDSITEGVADIIHSEGYERLKAFATSYNRK